VCTIARGGEEGGGDGSQGVSVWRRDVRMHDVCPTFALHGCNATRMLGVIQCEVTSCVTSCLSPLQSLANGTASRESYTSFWVP